MGEENLYDLRNHGEISQGRLYRSGMRDPIRVDISTTAHRGYGRRACTSGVNDSGNIFALSFLWKEKPL